MSANFRVHGSVEFRIDGRILIIRKSGPFNLEFELAYTRDVLIPVAQMERRGPYAVIMLYENSVLTTPEAMSYLIERVQRGMVPTPHCVGQAIVAAPDVEGQSLMPDLTERYFLARQLPAGTGRYFTELTSARQFLDGLINSAINAARPSGSNMP